MDRKIDIYDGFAAEYAASVAARDRAGIDDPLGILPPMLDLLGDLRGLQVLDAGCGEGYLARVLAGRGARVTGIDISPRLIEIARARDPEGTIEYRAADLAAPLPEYAGRFDAVASYLALNDVYDYCGFVTSLGEALRPGGSLIVALNNPYSYVVRKHVADYFDSGTAFPYRGMAAEGIKVHFYHRTLEEYLDAFYAAGLGLTKLVDVPRTASNNQDTLLPEGFRFPFMMVLGFTKS